jgi:hypothetical protein
VILSEKHKFVFIKGMKVAGTSVEMALSTLCGPCDIVTPISPVDELERLSMGGQCRNYADNPAEERAYLDRLALARREDLGGIEQPKLKYYNHMPLTEVVLKYGKPLADFRIVCVERSPYAKVISWANMRMTYGQYREGGEMRASTDHIRAYIDKAFATGAVAGALNLRRYRGPDGTFVAQTMRYETLGKDFETFVRSLGIDTVPPLPHAKKGLMSDGLDPRQVFRPDQIARINEMFAEEFAIFGYPRL